MPIQFVTTFDPLLLSNHRAQDGGMIVEIFLLGGANRDNNVMWHSTAPAILVQWTNQFVLTNASYQMEALVVAAVAVQTMNVAAAKFAAVAVDIVPFNVRMPFQHKESDFN